MTSDEELIARVEALADYLDDNARYFGHNEKRPPHPYPGSPPSANAKCADDLRALTALASKAERLQSQLPAEMPDCFIEFRECEKGHGWLTAKNWTQHPCVFCERDALRFGLVDAEALAKRPAPEAREWSEAHVFLDCDGVLADFDAHGLAYFGKPPRQAEAELGSKEFWRQLEARGDFYRSMPLMSDAMALFEGVKHLHPTILTGCPRGNWAEGQKVAWAAEHFPGVPIITCRSADKRNYAKPGDVLIDDWPQHRHRWIEMGGHFITHTDAATSLAALWAHYPTLRPSPPVSK